jgi:adenylate cyclase
VSSSELKQRLAAILAADVAGYSRLMAADERATVAALDAARKVFRSHIESSEGRVIDMAGDSVLAVFEAATGAVSAALAAQHELETIARQAPEDRRMRFRVGVHLGDIFEKSDGTVYGDGINVAARLQTLAAPGEVAVSDMVQKAVRGRVEAAFIDQGEKAMKNIADPVHWYCAGSPRTRAGVTDPLRRSAQELGALPSIIVLPFKVAAPEPEQAIFADGLRIDIQAALVKLSGLVLIAAGTANAYRNKELTPQQVASELGTRYVLEGFVQRSGDRARVRATLTDGATGQVLWSEHYDWTLDDAFEAQDEITERVVTALDVKLMSGEQARVWRKTIKDPRAREHFWLGIHEFFKGQKDANAIARANFEHVARLVPETSLGATMVAFTHWMDAFRGWAPSQQRSFDDAAKWAEKAMAMEDADGQAHTVMAHIHLNRREHEKALAVVEDALSLRPFCANANSHYASILYYCGRPADAADRMRQAMHISPVHPPWFKTILASACKECQQWSDAAQAAREVLHMKPDDVDARLVLIECALGSGDKVLAAEVAQEVRKLQPDFLLTEWAKRQPYRDAKVLERIVGALRQAGLS